MLFTTLNFILFLAVVLALFYGLPPRLRRYLLLAASLFFYMAWNAKFVVMLLGLITVDYCAGLWIIHKQGHTRRIALLACLCANIGLLGYFKYFNLLRDTLFWVARAAPPKPLDIILPLGISFHTFQSMSYVIDVYRGSQPAIRSYIDYALFVSFFPQLVAGPIVRAREFFLDYFNWRPPSAEEWRQGFTLILSGYIKKLILADRFASIADAYFANPAAMPGALTAWSAAVGFGLQIFFDFSGYTDIAIGIVLLFGFRFPENFRRPYLSASVTEFWRRWHMTLSHWLRDYIYIPLGGSREGAWRTYRNLMATMLIGGLWHGANWNFIIWGGYHGAALAIERALWGKAERRGLIRIPLTILTFAVVCAGWVFFRAKTFSSATFTLSEMFSAKPGPSLLHTADISLALCALAVAIAEEYGQALTRLASSPLWLRTAATAAALLCIELFTASDRPIPFVYFQF